VSTAIAGTSQAVTATAVLESMVGVTSHRERGQRVLGMLCEARGVSEGHLYVSAAEGIALCASLGSDAPPDGLSAFLEACIRLEQEQAESATAILTAAQLDAEVPVTSWTDPVGRVHLPLVLTCLVDGQLRQVGIASFVSEGNLQRSAIDPQLSSTLAACLIDGGDAKAGTDHG
jgi:hypothetical protein